MLSIDYTTTFGVVSSKGRSLTKASLVGQEICAKLVKIPVNGLAIVSVANLGGGIPRVIDAISLGRQDRELSFADEVNCVIAKPRLKFNRHPSIAACLLDGEREYLVVDERSSSNRQYASLRGLERGCR